MNLQELRLELRGGDPTLPARRVGQCLRDTLTGILKGACRDGLSVSPGVRLSSPHPDHQIGLRPIDTYEDLFVYRDWAHHLQGSPASDSTAQSHTTTVQTDTADTPTPSKAQQWWYHCYIHTAFESTDCLPFSKELLVGRQLADTGMQITDIDTQLVDLDGLNYSSLRAADAHTIEFLSPYVISSTVEGITDIAVDSWLADAAGLARRSIQFITNDTNAELITIDAGQLATYDGTSPIALAKMGILGMGGHAEHGFGGARIRPAPAERVESHHSSQPVGGTR